MDFNNFRQECFAESRHLKPNSVSALPCKTGNIKITAFHLNLCYLASKYIEHVKNYHQVI